jgi:hypothetical protein
VKRNIAGYFRAEIDLVDIPAPPAVPDIRLPKTGLPRHRAVAVALTVAVVASASFILTLSLKSPGPLAQAVSSAVAKHGTNQKFAEFFIKAGRIYRSE